MRRDKINSSNLILFLLSSVQALDKCLPILPQVDRTAMLNANVIDLQWISERTGNHWITSHLEGKVLLYSCTYSFDSNQFHCFHFQIQQKLQRNH